MTQPLAPAALPECAADRRYWLLRKALECVPLDQAIQLARTAEAFITEAAFSGPDRSTRAAEVPEAAPRNEEMRPDNALRGSAEAAVAAPRKQSGLQISAEQREELLDRMARGAKNTELAADYGLAPRQVQGIRMGSAREIGARRERSTPTPATADHKTSSSRREIADATETCMDEVVRYLRQQDDVVVPQEKGVFLVNARFRIPADELIARANRMRARQGKPEFKLAGQPSEQARDIGSTNGHPVFWTNSAAQAQG